MSEDSFYMKRGKRLFDVTVAATSLTTLMVPLLALGIAIYVIDGKPVFFRQARVGRRGRLFRTLKFRTMRQRSDLGSSVTTGNDPRVTPLGKQLRRFKLDELPQLWNVLVGDMSFVGPRPDVEGYADRLTGEERRILEVRPGITGPATLKYRNEEEILASVDDPQRYNDDVIYPDKVRINLKYLETVSFGYDLKCIARTLMPKA